MVCSINKNIVNNESVKYSWLFNNISSYSWYITQLFGLYCNVLYIYMNYGKRIYLCPPKHLVSDLSVCYSVCYSVYLCQNNFNICHYFLTIRYKAFVFLICIPCVKIFQAVPNFLTSWPWPWPLTYIMKTLTLVIGRAFIFHMSISCDKTFPSVPKVLPFWPLSWS